MACDLYLYIILLNFAHVKEFETGSWLRYTFVVGFSQKWLEFVRRILPEIAQHIEKFEKCVMPWQIGDDNHGRIRFGIVSTESESPFRIGAG